MGNILKKVDSLTGCFTRDCLLEFLNHLIIECSLSKKPFSILFIDLDHFKSMNDTYGHYFGDEMLKYFSSSMRLTLASEYMETEVINFIFRYGGDEFIIVLPFKNSQEAANMCRKLIDIIKKRHFLFRGRQFKLSFSSGIASYPNDATEIEELLKKADQALYFSKKHRKGMVTRYSGIGKERFKQVIVKFFIILGIGLAILVFRLSFQNNFRSIYFLNKEGKLQPKIYSIRLKTGESIKGTIIEYEDTLLVTLILDRGQGQILLKKSEIDKIEPYH